MNNRIIIGHVENIDLPDLGITQMTVRVDTGAQTSSLHVDNIQRTKLDKKSQRYRLIFTLKFIT